MSNFIDVAHLDDIPAGTMRHVVVGEREILLANVDGNIHAMSNRCGHMSASLADGTLDGNTVTCPFHSAHFDVTTGKKVRDAVLVPPPAIDKAPAEMLPYLQKAGRLSAPIKTHDCPRYDVKIENNVIKIKIDS